MAFEDIEASELFPVVTFYSSSPGEKVSAAGYCPSKHHSCVFVNPPHIPPPPKHAYSTIYFFTPKSIKCSFLIF